MKVEAAGSLTLPQKKEVLQLWNEEYPVKLRLGGVSDLDQYLEPLADQQHYLLKDDNNSIHGWSFTFQRENERWFAIIVGRSVKGMGYGKRLLDCMKRDEPVLNGWAIDHDTDQKANGECYVSPVNFYLKNGFAVVTDSRLDTEKMSAVKVMWASET